MVTGVDPEELEVDHKNGKEGDDRWENLRLATRSQNGVNTRHHAKSGHRGVWEKANGRWCASITDDKRQRHMLGQGVSNL